MKRLILLASILLIAATTVAAPTKTEPTVDIRADRVELDQKTGRIRFTGQVVVKQKDLELRCEQLQARYEKGGKLVELVATGQVRVTSPQWTASADAAHYQRKKEVLELTGSPRVRRGSDWIEGARVAVHLNEKRLIVESARGKIQGPVLRNLTEQ
jgi:lipopolysaccharide export system protein LptA